MFYISCKDSMFYGVTDTEDNVTEMYTIELITKFIRYGFVIHGVNLKPDFKNRMSKSGKLYSSFIKNLTPDDVVIRCKSNNVLNDFVSTINPYLAKLKLLGVSDYNAKVKKIQDEAISFGIINNRNQLSIDINAQKLYIKSPMFNTFVDFKSGETIDKVDACDKKVAELSKLGSEALRNITLKVTDDLSITMHDVIEEISIVDNYRYNPDDIIYIGITPSNRMLKVWLGSSIYSVKIDTVEKVRANKDKILGTKVEKVYGFDYYIRSNYNSKSKKWMISKFTKKHIQTYGYAYEVVNKMKEKYKTLHDVYCSPEYWRH